MSGTHIDVVLLSLFAIYATLTLPCTLVHLFQPSEILNGFFLHSGSLRLHNNTNLHQADMHGHSRMTRTRPIRSTSTSTNQTMCTLVDMLEDEEDVAGGVAMAKNKNKACTAHITPPHIMHTTLMYALNFRVSPSFSFGKQFVLIIYAVFMHYASLHHSNPFAANPMCTGYIALLQILIAVALAGKMNRLSWASVVGYEKACGSRSSVAYASVLKWHIIIITVNVQTLGYSAVGLSIFDHLARIAQTWYTTAWLTTKNALNGGTTLGGAVCVIVKGPYRNFKGSPRYTLCHTASAMPDDCDIQECLEHNTYDTPLKKGPKPL
ncbi:hypothetical protein F5148DRAFT_1153056 [Russula earlei]|uniref:Uncharacterized protein n=1 Tax=Russula earlei TaxID=71964 RepID=A0ACC0TV34_9AGAM|nr:hypothetical protein F5148DRAFT_1153056 [Russula earlei]